LTDDIEDRLSSASAAQLQRLMELVTEGPGTSDEALVRLSDPEALAEALSRVSSDDAGESAGVGRLLDRATPPGELRTLRLRYQQLSVRAGQANDLLARTAADLLSHACVAAAYVHHGVTISARPIAERRDLYAHLVVRLQAGPVAALFNAALRAM